MKLIRIENQKIGGGFPPGRAVGGHRAEATATEETTGHFPCRNGQTGRQAGEGEQMKEAWEKFENSRAAGVVVVVLWCGMLISIMTAATRLI